MSNGLEIHIARRVAVVWLAREKVRNAFRPDEPGDHGPSEEPSLA